MAARQPAVVKVAAKFDPLDLAPLLVSWRAEFGLSAGDMAYLLAFCIQQSDVKEQSETVGELLFDICCNKVKRFPWCRWLQESCWGGGGWGGRGVGGRRGKRRGDCLRMNHGTLSMDRVSLCYSTVRHLH